MDSIQVIGVGKSYQVGDIAYFDTTEDVLSSEVSRIEGVSISRLRKLLSHTCLMMLRLFVLKPIKFACM